MSMVKIKGKEYKLRFSIGFWKGIQEVCGVTRENMHIKLNEDFAVVASNIVHIGIYYGLSKMPESIAEMEVTIKDIENELDGSVMDAIEEAVIEGMTKAEKRSVDLVRKQQEAGYKELEDKIDSKKKELQSLNIDSQ